MGEETLTFPIRAREKYFFYFFKKYIYLPSHVLRCEVLDREPAGDCVLVPQVFARHVLAAVVVAVVDDQA